MMDFTDLSSVVKKATKKATSIAMKPVKLVTDPVISLNKSLKKSVFGPEMSLFYQLKEEEQHKLLHTVWSTYIAKGEKQLREKKITPKKITAYIQALKLLEVAHQEGGSLEEKSDTMQSLLDELRSSCKEGIPTKLVDNTFVTDKKTAFTSDELTYIHEHIATTKKFLSSTIHQLEDDMTPLMLTNAPETNTLWSTIGDQRKGLTEEVHEPYQKALFAINDQISTGRSLINEMSVCCDRLKKYHDKQSSLFATEKNKQKSVEELELKTLTEVATKKFGEWEKTYSKKVDEWKKTQPAYDTVVDALQKTWGTFFQTWSSWHKQTVASSQTTAKNYKTYLRTCDKVVDDQQKALNAAISKATKLFVTPFNQAEQLNKELDGITKQHTVVHDDYLLNAKHIWTTGAWGELPSISALWLIDERTHYVAEEITLLRIQLLHQKLTRRIRRNMYETMSGYISKLNDRKQVAKTVIQPVITKLTTHNNELKKQLDLIEKSITRHETFLSNNKKEIWDSVTARRLFDTKRLRQQNMTWSAISSDHAPALAAEVKIQRAQLQAAENAYKELLKKQNIDRTALDEQQKTVTIVKTKEQKDKLALLEKQVKNQEIFATKLNEVIESMHAHISETEGLSKKYAAYAKQYQSYADTYKKSNIDLSKKLKKSPISNRIDCSDKCPLMFG